MAQAPARMVDPAIFEYLQNKIDEDIEVREQVKNILQTLEKQGRTAQAVLAKAHSLPSSQYAPIISETEKSISEQVQTVAQLAETASKYPYYKYNILWSRDIQNTCFYILFCGWLGGLSSLAPESSTEGSNKQGRLLTIEEVGSVLRIPINLKDSDAFHLSIEEYLHSLISLIDELARLAVNSVTHGDYSVPLLISRFVKDVHAGFQVLSLKNDSLRRRSDSIKYSVKKVEDVVYDLSLRNLVPSGS